MKTATYLRQSPDRDLTKVSIDYQREGLLKLCADKRWDDPVEYMDRNVSATTGRRDAYEDLCEDIRNGIVGRVAVWDMDRLHRQPRELEDFIDLAEKHHVELANVGGDVNLSTPSGRMFARMKGTVAKYEVEQKGVRQKAANKERAKTGKPWVGRTFGYDGDKTVETEAEAIRQACAEMLNGASLWSIANDWNSRGITTVKGCTWTGGTVKQVPIRARNAGLQTYDEEVLEDIETSWPAIVSRDTWDAVRAYLANPNRHTGKKRARVHLLSGLAVCGLCGRKMGTTGRKTKTGAKRMVYQCKNTGCMRVVLHGHTPGHFGSGEPELLFRVRQHRRARNHEVGVRLPAPGGRREHRQYPAWLVISRGAGRFGWGPPFPRPNRPGAAKAPSPAPTSPLASGRREPGWAHQHTTGTRTKDGDRQRHSPRRSPPAPLEESRPSR
jgi:DNA invertase Pin-like site-specific DNA recombinase